MYFSDYLKKIVISPSNGKFEFKKDQYLVGKSDENSDEFDVLLFVRRHVEGFLIPSSIEIIGSHSFQYSRIKEISIPATVIKISEGAFSNCTDLTKIDIPPNSTL